MFTKISCSNVMYGFTFIIAWYVWSCANNLFVPRNYEMQRCNNDNVQKKSVSRIRVRVRGMITLSVHWTC